MTPWKNRYVPGGTCLLCFCLSQLTRAKVSTQLRSKTPPHSQMSAMIKLTASVRSLSSIRGHLTNVKNVSLFITMYAFLHTTQILYYMPYHYSIQPLPCYIHSNYSTEKEKDPQFQRSEIFFNYTSLNVVQLVSIGYSLPLQPNCRHTTLASLMSHVSSHTEPHTPLRHISTLPSSGVTPSTSLTPVSLHSANACKYN